MTAESALPVVDPHRPQPRDVPDVINLAVATQANVAQLRTAEARARDINPAAHDIRTPSPGAVTQRRDALIDYKTIQVYSPPELHIRLHEIWGQFCVFCWSLHIDDAHNPPPLKGDHEMRCASSIALKTAEIEGFLWRLQFEQRLRHDPMFRDAPGFADRLAFAEKIPVEIACQGVAECDDHALFTSSCEHAGMLAAIRWIADRRRTWGDPELMAVDHDAFTAAADRRD